MPKNIFIQKIVDKREVNNKECQYLLTINKGAKLERAEIFWKKELIEYLEEKLF